MTAAVMIPGVPESITREQYSRLIESAGISVTHLRKLEFRPDGIYAEVFALNDEGLVMADPATGEAVMHRVYIRVDDARHG